MIKWIVAIFILLHGLIHLMGFLKAFDMAEIAQLTLSIPKRVGVLWLIAALLFVVSVGLLLLDKSGWWGLGLVAVLLSQFLIFSAWGDAKFGSVPNVVWLIVCVIGLGSWNFDRQSAGVVSEMLLHDSVGHSEVVTAESIAHLPEIVQRWLVQSKVVGNPKIQSAHIFQSGELRLDADSKWKPLRAEQWFSISKPGFVWNADVGLGSLMQFAGRDQYLDGKGKMLIKLYSWFAVVNESGPNIDNGVAVRYLSEIIWFPSAALGDFIVWESVGPLQAKATLSDGGQSVSGVFTFNEVGQVTRFEAPRFYDESKSKETWVIGMDTDSARDFGHWRIPTVGTVTWQLKGGDFTWLKVKIVDAELR